MRSSLRCELALRPTIRPKRDVQPTERSTRRGDALTAYEIDCGASRVRADSGLPDGREKEQVDGVFRGPPHPDRGEPNGRDAGVAERGPKPRLRESMSLHAARSA